MSKIQALIVMVITGFLWWKLAKWIYKMDKRNGL